MKPRPVLFFGAEKMRDGRFLAGSEPVTDLADHPARLGRSDAAIVRSAATGLRYPVAMRRTASNRAAHFPPAPVAAHRQPRTAWAGQADRRICRQLCLRCPLSRPQYPRRAVRHVQPCDSRTSLNFARRSGRGATA